MVGQIYSLQLTFEVKEFKSKLRKGTIINLLKFEIQILKLAKWNLMSVSLV